MFRRRIRRNHFTGRRTGGKLSGHAKVEQETTVPMTRHKRGRDTARFLLRHKLLFGVLGATALLLVGMLAGVAILLSGAFSTAATTQHTAFTHWLLDTGLRYSLAAGADGIEVPELSDASMIERGRTCFRAHCVHCHGAPALARAPHGLGMMPIPNDLTESSRPRAPDRGTAPAPRTVTRTVLVMVMVMGRRLRRQNGDGNGLDVRRMTTTQGHLPRSCRLPSKVAR
jgi:hypothetical protein